MKLLEADKLGSCPIDSVKLSDTKEWALRMKEKGISYKTISNDKRSLKAAFYTAIQDDCIRKNPFDFQLNTVFEDDTEPKVPPSQENRKKYEEALPKVMTPHTLRHTFCTNLANAGMNPKALQYIMGHSNITMTLNYYAHATFASARAEMERLIAA
jgi:integrase